MRITRYQLHGHPVRSAPLPVGCVVVETLDQYGNPMLSLRKDGHPVGEAWIEAHEPSMSEPQDASRGVWGGV